MRATAKRFAVLLKIADAGHYAFRVLTEDGPLRDCPWCGLFAEPAAAVAHAGKHRVEVDDHQLDSLPPGYSGQSRPEPKLLVMPANEVVTVPALVESKPALIPVTAEELRAPIPDLRPELTRREAWLKHRAAYWKLKWLGRLGAA